MSTISVQNAATTPAAIASGAVAGAAMPGAPSLDQIPSQPASWLLFGRSRDVGHKPVTRELLGRPLVAFRDSAGQVALLDGQCVHMGADLGRGRVVGNAIECPFHAWRFGRDGRCAHIPACADIPAFARQRSYAVEERGGAIFFFSAARPLFPLPFFSGHDPGGFVCAAPVRVRYAAPWYMIACNAFDLQHLSVVHDRVLEAPPVIDTPWPFARRSRYVVRVSGRSVQDRLLRRLVGDRVQVELTVWAGNVVTVRAAFRRAVSWVWFIISPDGPGASVMDVFTHRPRVAGALDRLMQPLSLRVRRWFTRGFVQHESDTLGTARYSPRTLIDADREVIEYFNWLASLPRT